MLVINFSNPSLTQQVLPSGRIIMKIQYNNRIYREVDDETIIFWEPVTYGYYVDAAPNLILDSVLDLFLKSHNFTEFLPILEQVIMMSPPNDPI